MKTGFSTVESAMSNFTSSTFSEISFRSGDTLKRTKIKISFVSNIDFGHFMGKV